MKKDAKVDLYLTARMGEDSRGYGIARFELFNSHIVIYLCVVRTGGDGMCLSCDMLINIVVESSSVTCVMRNELQRTVSTGYNSQAI